MIQGHAKTKLLWGPGAQPYSSRVLRTSVRLKDRGKVSSQAKNCYKYVKNLRLAKEVE